MNRVSLEHARERPREEEDRDDRGERELEARVEQQVRVPAEQHDGSERQHMPLVALPRDQPRDRHRAARDGRSDHRRLRTDRQHVRRRSRRARRHARPRAANRPATPGRAHRPRAGRRSDPTRRAGGTAPTGGSSTADPATARRRRPSTTPAITARRCPVKPGAASRRSQSRSRSARPPSPPR